MINVNIEEKCICGCNIVENDGIDYNDNNERCYVFSLDCEDKDCFFSESGFYDDFYALEPNFNTLIDKASKLTSELIYKIQFVKR